MTDDDIELLEFLIKSPAFAALRRCLEGTRLECLSVLASSKETHEIFHAQGKLIGVQTVANLPGILVAQRAAQAKKVETEAKKFKKFKQT